MAQLNRKIAGS